MRRVEFVLGEFVSIDIEGLSRIESRKGLANDVTIIMGVGVGAIANTHESVESLAIG